MSPTLLQAKSNCHLLRKCCLRILPGFLPSLQHLGCSNHSKRHSAVSPHSLRETSVQTFPLTVHVTGPCIKVTCRHDFSLPAFRTGDYKLFTFEHPIAPDVAPLEITTQHVRKEGRNEGQGGEGRGKEGGGARAHAALGSHPTRPRPQAGAGRRGPALPPQCPGRLPQSWVTERQGHDGAGGERASPRASRGGAPWRAAREGPASQGRASGALTASVHDARELARPRDSTARGRSKQRSARAPQPRDEEAWRARRRDPPRRTATEADGGPRLTEPHTRQPPSHGRTVSLPCRAVLAAWAPCAPSG